MKKLNFSRMHISITLLVIFAVLSFYTLFVSGIFNLQSIKFVPESLECASTEKIREILPRGKNMLFLNSEELATIIKAKFPCLSSIRLRKQFPDTISVSISERIPAAFLKVGVFVPEPLVLDTPEATSSSQSAQPQVTRDEFLFNDAEFPQLYAVDKEGVILTENPGYVPDIVTFYFESERELRPSEVLDKDLIQNSLGILAQLKERSIAVDQAKVSRDSLYILGESKYIFKLKKDPGRQVISLQLILQKAKIDSVSVDKVDLRFDKPVVVYNKKK